jgi:hypothetical protein
VGFCWDRSGLYFAGYFIWERTNYEPRGIERRPHQAKALGHLDLAIQFASPGTANSATAPRLGLAGADFLRLRCPIIDRRSNGASQTRSCAK